MRPSQTPTAATSGRCRSFSRGRRPALATPGPSAALLRNMGFRTTSTKPGVRTRAAGFTVVELLIGLAISGLILAEVCALWFYSSRSFAAQMSYVDLDQSSQRALDVLSREIRCVK